MEASPKPNLNWVRVGGGPPFLLSYSYYMEGGILLPVGIGLPRARHSRGPALPLLHSFIYGGGGTP